MPEFFIRHLSFGKIPLLVQWQMTSGGDASNVAVWREPPGCKQKPEGLRSTATIVHLFLNKQ